MPNDALFTLTKQSSIAALLIATSSTTRLCVNRLVRHLGKGGFFEIYVYRGEITLNFDFRALAASSLLAQVPTPRAWSSRTGAVQHSIPSW